MNIPKKSFTKWHLATALLILPLFTQVLGPVLLQHASASGSLSNTFVRFDRMKQSTGGAGDVFTTGTVCAKPFTAGTEVDVKVTFPTGMTVSTTTANWTTSTTNLSWPSGGTAWLGIGTATAASGQTVTFPSTDLVVGTLYCFNWTNTSAALKTNTTVAANQTGTVVTEATGSATIDSGNYATQTVANDQIAVTATVNATFSFALSSNTAAIGTLTTANPVSASNINATVSTNASHGWQVWAADLTGTPGLRSTTASKTISYSPAAGSAAAALTANTEGYNLGAGTATGTVCTSVTPDANFTSVGTAFKGGGLDATLRSLAVSTGVADTCALPLTVSASISGTTPSATDYADTITVVGAGNF